MTWTYQSSDLGSSSVDDVRIWIGDTSSGDQLLQDEEIQFVLNNYTANVLLASAECCELIASGFARKADFANEGLSVKASQRADAYTKRAGNLRDRAVSATLDIFVGGRSISDKEDRAGESDLVQPFFTRDRDDYPGTVVDDSTS